MKELIFFDVDDTLLDSRTHKIPESTKQALQELQKEYLLGIATGRSLSTLYDNGVIDAADWSIYVCNNGQLVYDQKHKEIYRNPMDPSVAKRVIETALAHSDALLVGTPEWFQIGEVNAYEEEAHQFFHIPIPDPLMNENPDIFMMVTYGPRNDTYERYRSIDGITIMPGQSTYCDIVAKGFNKYTGIQAALSFLKRDAYLAFGDSNNDLEMLTYAQYAIVMGQGSEQAKQYANFITKPVYEDGIAYALAHCEQFVALKSYGTEKA